MANPIQQASVQRKLIYIGLILVLFTASYVFRRYGVEAYAGELKLREQDRGEVTLTDTAVGLSLTGLRGFVVTYLWWDANEIQKKHEWNKLEKRVRWVTRLQPHFISPWLFQSWNLSYNVSVELDRERDQYFYIARGIELLYAGEQRNRNHPDLRFYMAHYTMSKIGQGDKKNVLQSLLEMSCIDPKDRDPDRFGRKDERGRRKIDLAEFETFCRQNPHLVRRLRDKLRCNRPEDVVKFLEENQKLPSLYQEPRPDQEETPMKADPGERFPLLPPPRTGEFDPSALNDKTNVRDYLAFVDAYLVAHAWFSYAQEALPQPDPDMPGKEALIVDRTRQRRPKMTTLIFRIFPARAMSYVAERMEQEGWFDNTGWIIDSKDAGGVETWFPQSDGVSVGADRNWGVEFWGRASTMWEEHGRRNLLLIDPFRDADLRAKAEQFRQAMGLRPDERPRQARLEEVPENLRDGFRAHVFLLEQEYYLSLTNFRHFHHTSLIEAKPETVAARKKFFEAERHRLQFNRVEALEKYEAPEGLPKWKELLETHPDFQADDLIQEESYEIQMKYLDVVKAERGPTIKQLLGASNLMLQARVASPVPLLISTQLASVPRVQPDLVLAGPFDVKVKRIDKISKKEIEVPMIRDEIKELARGRAASRAGIRR